MLIVVDTDPGVDDAFALVGLLARAKRGDCRVAGIGTVHGNLPPEPGADNALRITELLGLDIPVAVGEAKPLVGPEMQSGQIVHGEDGLGGNAGPAPDQAATQESAAEQLVRLARQHPGEITVLALGPLTNLAKALEIEPDLPNLVEHVIWMGGVFTLPRHGRRGPGAERLARPGGRGAGPGRRLPDDGGADRRRRRGLGRRGVDRRARQDRQPGGRALTAWHKQYLDFYSGTLAVTYGGPACSCTTRWRRRSR